MSGFTILQSKYRLCVRFIYTEKILLNLNNNFYNININRVIINFKNTRTILCNSIKFKIQMYQN